MDDINLLLGEITTSSRVSTCGRSAPAKRLAGLFLLAATSVYLAACGGGGDGSANPTSSGSPNTGIVAHSVVVKTVDTSRRPISGVSISLNGGLNGQAKNTDETGEAAFSFNARTHGELSATTFVTNYYPAAQTIDLAGATSHSIELELIRLDEVVVTLVGVTSEVSADESLAIVHADVRIANRNGDLVSGKTTTDFSIPTIDCLGFGFPCFLDAAGISPLGGSWWPSSEVPFSVDQIGSDQSAFYRITYLLQSNIGAFRTGRTVVTLLDIRLGRNTSTGIQVNVAL